MGKSRALRQDIRPLKIVIVNLMPTKIATETQLIRMLSNTPLQIEIELLHMATHNSTHTSQEHFKSFYKTFEEIRERRYDGLIVTGAPVEHLPFEEVDYWEELKEILKWSDKNITSTVYLCWAAQAGLYYHYGIGKKLMKDKMFGIFPHRIADHKSPLLRGFNDEFLAPHSRHTEVSSQDIEKVRGLKIIADSEEAGVYIVTSADERKIFVIGHLEYDADTLKSEYFRDREKGLVIDIPKNYFPNDDPSKSPLNSWRSFGFLFFSNWLNYCVYQTTPYNWVNK
jgi:homoserine O-succinyltransferase